MDKGVREYIENQREHGRRPLTLEDYEVKLGQCMRELRAAGMSTEPGKIGEAEFRHLLGSLSGSEQTVRCKVQMLDRYIQHETGRSVLAQMDILWNRQVEKRRIFIDGSEYSRLLKAAKPWERIILVLGGMMGLRRQEMLDIRLRDIRDDAILIHGKGHGAAGLVAPQPMPEGVRSEIDRYLGWRRTQTATDDFLVIIPDGKQHGGLSGRTFMAANVSRMISRLGRRVGVTLTTHSLRRFYGTSVYEISEGDIDLTRRLMRHADPRVTLECYIRPDEKKKRRTVDALAGRYL